MAFRLTCDNSVVEASFINDVLIINGIQIPPKDLSGLNKEEHDYYQDRLFDEMSEEYALLETILIHDKNLMKDNAFNSINNDPVKLDIILEAIYRLKSGEKVKNINITGNIAKVDERIFVLPTTDSCYIEWSRKGNLSKLFRA